MNFIVGRNDKRNVIFAWTVMIIEQSLMEAEAYATQLALIKPIEMEHKL